MGALPGGVPLSSDLDALEGLPRDGDGPVFREPWEAQAFALTVDLSERGLFTWQEWAEALAEEIRLTGEAGDLDLGDTYYRHWARALTKLLSTRGAVTPGELEERTEMWRQAYLATPHGQPVELSAAAPRAPRQTGSKGP